MLCEGEAVLVLLLAEGEGFFGEVEAFLGQVLFRVEFCGAELVFVFLDFGLTFADGGVFLAADDRGDAVEGVEVGGLFVAGGGELEGGLFEHAEASVCEVGLAGGGEFEDLGGGFRGFGSLCEVIFEGGFGVETLESGFGDFGTVFFFDEVGDFVVGVVVEPGGDLEELVAGELGEAGVWGFLIFELRF